MIGRTGILLRPSYFLLSHYAAFQPLQITISR
jgi:hypothetical protein